jgi:hypothetical protein
MCASSRFVCMVRLPLSCNFISCAITPPIGLFVPSCDGVQIQGWACGALQRSPTSHRARWTNEHLNRHLTLLFSIFWYSISYVTFNYYSKWAQFNYRLAFISAAATYGIVVYKAFRARARAGNKAQGSVLSLAADENVQYLGTCPYQARPAFYATY